MLQRIIHGETPRGAVGRRRRCRRRLSAVCARAMAKARAERYAERDGAGRGGAAVAGRRAGGGLPRAGRGAAGAVGAAAPAAGGRQRRAAGRGVVALTVVGAVLLGRANSRTADSLAKAEANFAMRRRGGPVLHQGQRGQARPILKTRVRILSAR